ncbi:N-acetylmuramoyl-L-alanine amidase [Candidatus Saganbacteria bacterium]|nr:N-acetylmuramoyl-L-alanine amidase [Candidatus Saganbacteria bacterium]
MGSKALFLLFLILLSPVAFASPAQILQIEISRDRGFDYFDISTCGETKAKGMLLDNQLQVIFKDAALSPDIKISKGRSRRIKAIRLEQTSSEARVIIDFTQPIDYDIVNVFGRGKSIIEIFDRFDQAEQIMAAWEKANLATRRQLLKPYKLSPDPAGKDQSLAGKIFVLDPGHGGLDPGAIARDGSWEKNLTLAVAQKTALLLQGAGATVYLTRNDDRTKHLQDIVDYANGSKCDIFISIHYNFTSQSEIGGTETYYYNPQSRPLALILHESLLAGIERKDRGLRRAMYYAVHHTTMPAVLLEPVYLSNDKELKLAGSPDFQYQLAKSIVKGVKTYFRGQSNK